MHAAGGCTQHTSTPTPACKLGLRRQHHRAQHTWLRPPPPLHPPPSPFCARASQVAQPMPEDAPVTRATLPPHFSSPGCTPLPADGCEGGCTGATAAGATAAGAAASTGWAGAGAGAAWDAGDAGAGAAWAAAVAAAAATGACASALTGSACSEEPGREMSGSGACKGTRQGQQYKLLSVPGRPIPVHPPCCGRHPSIHELAPYAYRPCGLRHCQAQRPWGSTGAPLWLHHSHPQ